MRAFGIVLVLCTFGLAASQARSQDKASGNFLIGACHVTVSVIEHTGTIARPLEAWRAGYCRGVVVGVDSVATLGGQVCKPEGVTSDQEVRVVAKYLEDHPESLNQTGSILAFQALRDAFPCKH